MMGSSSPQLFTVLFEKPGSGVLLTLFLMLRAGAAKQPGGAYRAREPKRGHHDDDDKPVNEIHDDLRGWLPVDPDSTIAVQPVKFLDRRFLNDEMNSEVWSLDPRDRRPYLRKLA